jgi:tRNA-dihydrouridine synthase A
MLGLRHGQPGARRWRQVWSDASLKAGSPDAAQRQARAAVATLRHVQNAATA